MGEIVSEIYGEDYVEQGLPPGFRFHPTDEELITFYLASKVFNGRFCGIEIAEVDLNRCEPWELPDIGKMGEREWYFFSPRDRKYPTGLRTNRATEAGYWKATGKDREIFSAGTGNLVGMKKTLVFYRGRAPRGEKTKWVMHEYRLEGEFSCRNTNKEEWVICRIVHKTNMERKFPFCPPLNPLLEVSPTMEIHSLPPLLDYSVVRQEIDVKSMIDTITSVHPFPFNWTDHQESDVPKQMTEKQTIFHQNGVDWVQMNLQCMPNHSIIDFTHHLRQCAGESITAASASLDFGRPGFQIPDLPVIVPVESSQPLDI